MNSESQAGCFQVAALILAAGQASRMGTLKQLLVFEGETLLTRAIRTAREAGFAPVIVVTGAGREPVQASIAKEPVEVIWNANWQSGMGSSIAAGTRHLQALAADVAGVAILLSDQPLLTSEHLKSMRHRLNTEPSSVAIAAEYGGSFGVPAIFKRELFTRLAEIPSESGAKMLLQSPDILVTGFTLPEGAIDIDTRSDFDRLTAQNF